MPTTPEPVTFLATSTPLAAIGNKEITTYFQLFDYDINLLAGALKKVSSTR